MMQREREGCKCTTTDRGEEEEEERRSQIWSRSRKYERAKRQRAEKRINNRRDTSSRSSPLRPAWSSKEPAVIAGCLQ